MRVRYAILSLLPAELEQQINIIKNGKNRTLQSINMIDFLITYHQHFQIVLFLLHEVQLE